MEGTRNALLDKEADELINAGKHERSGRYPYASVDGTYLKRSWGGEIKNVSVLVAIGVNEDGCREIFIGSAPYASGSLMMCCSSR